MATLTQQPVAARAAPGKRSSIARREANWGLIFLSPWIIGFLIFTALPMLASLVFSFTDFNLVQLDQIHFIGLGNYGHIFTDPQVSAALWVTVRFGLLSVPLGLATALLLAVIVNSKHLLATNVFRTLLYLPVMIPIVAGTLIWKGVLNSQAGWVNQALQVIGIQGPNWLGDPAWILPSLTLMAMWGVGNAMLIMLAGLQGVPTDLYEAARVDGASGWYTFFTITIPMVSPVIFYNLTLGLIGAFQYFTQAYVISGGTGNPDGATMFYNLYLYKTSFLFNNMGYGATLAWVMFAICLVLTLTLFSSASRWVYYAGGDE